MLFRSAKFFALGIALFAFGFSVQPSAPNTIEAEQIISATNLARASSGLPPLTQNQKLSAASAEKLSDMAGMGYFSHNSPAGTGPWHWIVKNDYAYASAGENLAINFDDAQKLVRAWLTSPAHKKNLLNPHYSDVGVSVQKVHIRGKTYTLVVQMLAAPKTLSVN
ncbi:MAG: CAP domain-containing protein [Candidatus Doudnabacteria bacterium]|nr:CAP domain-containing protein [Candidatus Doudnabacteria bacterium]